MSLSSIACRCPLVLACSCRRVGYRPLPISVRTRLLLLLLPPPPLPSRRCTRRPVTPQPPSSSAATIIVVTKLSSLSPPPILCFSGEIPFHIQRNQFTGMLRHSFYENWVYSKIFSKSRFRLSLTKNKKELWQAPTYQCSIALVF